MAWRDAMGNTWGKILVTLLPLLAVGIVATITLREKVSRLEADVVEAKARYVTREEVQGKLDAILRELGALREDYRDLRRPR